MNDPTTIERLEKLGAQIDAHPAAFFSKPALARSNRTIVVAVDDGLAFRLGRTSPDLRKVDQLLGVRVFELCAGRPFHAWRVVPTRYAHLWGELLQAAR